MARWVRIFKKSIVYPAQRVDTRPVIGRHVFALTVARVRTRNTAKFYQEVLRLFKKSTTKMMKKVSREKSVSLVRLVSLARHSPMNNETQQTPALTLTPQLPRERYQLIS